MKLDADTSTDDHLSLENGGKRGRVTGERMHGDEERFVAATTEAWAPTSVTRSVIFAVVPS